MHNVILSAEEKWLLALMRCAVCGSGGLPDEPMNWEVLLRLAKKHRVEALICRGLNDVSDVPDDVWERLRSAWRYALMRDARQEHTARVIEEAFDKHQISFAPMKGLILKNDYPCRELRYMSDLDYYICAEDRGRIHAVMESLGAVVANTDSGDVNYEMPGKICVEFHGMLLYQTGGVGVQSYSDRSRVLPDQNRLTEEGYALNLLGHVISNLAQAGCGVRFVLDIWVYRHKHSSQPDWDAVMEQLKEDGLDRVAQNLLDLSEYWFGNGAGSELLDELGAYILEGGLYGLERRATLSAAGSSGGKLGAVKAQFFRSRDEFENRYPWLKKYPFLLPVAWVMRAVNSLKTHRAVMKQWMNQLNWNDRDEVLEQRERLQRFGFLLRENKKSR